MGKILWGERMKSEFKTYHMRRRRKSMAMLLLAVLMGLAYGGVIVASIR